LLESGLEGEGSAFITDMTSGRVDEHDGQALREDEAAHSSKEIASVA